MARIVGIHLVLRASERSTEQLGNAMDGWMGGPVAWAQKP